MLSVIIGGSASGKSAWAEKLVCALPGDRIYIATMLLQDDESRLRAMRHRNNRAGKGFTTVEQPVDLSSANIPAGSNVLLECMGNLLANELYCPEGGGEQAVMSGIDALLGRCAHLTVVTNEVFSGGAGYGPETLDYMRMLAGINRRLAARADLVCEMTAGLPHLLKGKAPWAL